MRCNMKWLNHHKMKWTFVGIAAAIVVGGGRVKADFIWTQEADMPIQRYQHSASVVGGKIYVIGGWDLQWGALTRVDEYDPVTDTWTREADMPTARGFTSASVVNEKIYVMDGDAEAEPISIVEVYDPVTDTWAEQTELPTKRSQFTTSVVDGIIYVIGGYMPSIDSRTGLVEAYDPTTDTWTRKTDMPTIKTFTSSCVVDGKIYVIGGAWTREVVEAYDPTTDTWTVKAHMPTPRYLLGTSVVGGKIYAIGGYFHSINGPIYASVEVYDPRTDTWTKGFDIPITLAGMSTSLVDGKIYVIGGTVATHPGGNWVFTSAVYANEPIVDLSGDGIVDAADMCIVVDNWDTDYSLCDIGPMPWGDGVVDVEDLEILAEHLFEEVDDPTLMAHWPLDEAQGDIAYNNVSDHDGTLIGSPTWQPDDGMVGGAIQLDGIDDFVEADFVLDPADGRFSAVAWIKGGAPDQVVLSQTDGVNWLCIDSIDGCLMTELTNAGRSSVGPMLSQLNVTDVDWHRIGFVWDGSNRHLYVDGTEVATDAAPLSNLESAEGGLYFGAGSTLAPGTFFSGMIDDVRIYNRAVKP